jgi:hypothetical protein
MPATARLREKSAKPNIQLEVTEHGKNHRAARNRMLKGGGFAREWIVIR